MSVLCNLVYTCFVKRIKEKKGLSFSMKNCGKKWIKMIFEQQHEKKALGNPLLRNIANSAKRSLFISIGYRRLSLEEISKLHCFFLSLKGDRVLKNGA